MSTTIELTIGTYTRGRDSDQAASCAPGSRPMDADRASRLHPVTPTVDPTWVVAAPTAGTYTRSPKATRARSLPSGDERGGRTRAARHPPDRWSRDLPRRDRQRRHAPGIGELHVSGSLSVHPIGADGTLGARSCLVQHVGSGPDPTARPARTPTWSPKTPQAASSSPSTWARLDLRVHARRRRRAASPRPRRPCCAPDSARGTWPSTRTASWSTCSANSDSRSRSAPTTRRLAR
jgi:hypothetical protein